MMNNALMYVVEPYITQELIKLGLSKEIIILLLILI